MLDSIVQLTQGHPDWTTAKHAGSGAGISATADAAAAGAKKGKPQLLPYLTMIVIFFEYTGGLWGTC